MELFMSLFVAGLFVALTPGVLVTLPSKGSKLTVAVVHGLLFAVVYHLTRKVVSHFLFSNGLTSSREAFQTMEKQKEAEAAGNVAATAAMKSEASAKAVNDALAAAGGNTDDPEVMRLGAIALADLRALEVASEGFKALIPN